MQSGVLQTSTNAIIWQLRTSGFGSNSILSSIFQNNTYIIAGSNGALSTSTNAITWTLRTAGTTSSFYSLIFQNNNYIICGTNGVITISTDAITWSLRTSNTAGTINSLTFGNNTYLAGGGSGTLVTSQATQSIWEPLNSSTTILQDPHHTKVLKNSQVLEHFIFLQQQLNFIFR